MIKSLLVLMLFVVSFGISEAHAQTEPPPVITPLRVEADRNGVNLISGLTSIDLPRLSVPAAPRLSFSRLQDVAPYLTGSFAGGDPDGAKTYFSAHLGGTTSESFKCLSEDCKSVVGSGSQLSGFGLMQARTGAQYTFDVYSYDSYGYPSGGGARQIIYYASSIKYPDGEIINFTYDSSAQGVRVYNRPTFVSSSLGYTIAFTYYNNTYSNAWFRPQSATLYAMSAPTVALAKFTYSADTSAITDLGGRVYICGCANGFGNDVEAPDGFIQLPSESSPAKQITQYYVPFVGSVTNDGVTWNYDYSNVRSNSSNGGYLFDKVTVTGPDNLSDQFLMKVVVDRMYIDTWIDRLGRSTKYEYDGKNRPISITNPEFDKTTVVYDAFANVIQKTVSAKPGSGLVNRVESSYVDVINCFSVNCYRPVWTRDALNRQTDYIYNEYGQITEQTDPADSAGVRKKTYITYTTTLPSRASVVRVCGDTTTCGTSAEFRTEYDYWGSTSLPSAMRQIDAAAGVTLTTSYQYDSAGRLQSVDGPFPGSDDIKFFRYDIYGRKTWEISALAPDGLRLAKRYTYRDSDDKVVAVEMGTIPSETSTSLTVTARTDTIYDARRYPVREALSSGGATYQVTDKSYTDRGEAICTATRMNMASLLSDACTLGTQGAQGPDRVTKNIYDNASELIQVRKAVGTPLEQAYATYSYTGNGKQQFMLDANGNRTKMEYDGFDRLAKWIFPATTPVSGFNPATQANALATAGALNPNDYEQYGYDAVGNRLTFRKRDGNLIGYSYDNLNRPVFKNIPGGTASDVYYDYDIRGLQLSARFGSPSGTGVLQSYDGFGRLSSSTNTMAGVARTLSYLYDADGNRTRVTHPDGVYVGYSYDALDRVTKGRWTTAGVTTPFMMIAYDAQGRRSDIARASSNTGYGYDSAGRLGSMDQRFAGSTGNVTQTFGYNPASQVTSLTRDSNDYAFPGYVAVNRSYAVNGLNQYTSGGPATFSYDANGNLTGDGTRSYAYDVENRLIASGGVTLAYDPNGHLWQTAGGAYGSTQFLYDGEALVAEYDGGTGALRRRYLHGAGVDEPVVWDEAGAMNCSGTRVLHADYQGSIVAVADCSGNRVQVNSYDEYGIPAASNFTSSFQQRFQYTGQAWIPELGMYYYKARMYSPTLGRFMQTDPIGYKDQVNLYAYVANDPVNGTDPSGEETCTTDSEGKTTCVPDPPEEKDIVVTAKRPESTAATTAGTVASILVPGYDLANCAISGGCSTADWIFAGIDVIPAGKLISKGRKAYKAFRAFRRACGCFAAGTLVSTPTGLVAIETLSIGDMVLAYDEVTRQVAPRRITQLIRPQPKLLYRLVAQNADGAEAEFLVTDDHPWKVEGAGWVKTIDLKVAQRIETAKGASLLIQVIAPTERVEGTYNLTVDGLHTFLVGEDGAIVHNVDCKKAMREFRTNKAFKDYVHKEKQSSGMAGDGAGTRNRDLSDEEIGDMYDDWIADGGPGRK